jgi:transposase
MKFIKGNPRNQAPLIPLSLEEMIGPENEVRVIDLFVDSLPLADYGFKVDQGENGRPAYHPADLLKLYLYGYLNRIRSSRHLEKECYRNLEVRWLLKELTPDHNTIAAFRKNNPKAIREVFRATVRAAQHFKLIGGKLLAVDSTKLRAQNSKKNNYNIKKVDRHLDYIDNQLAQYEQQLAQADGDADPEAVMDEVQGLLNRRQMYEDLKEELLDGDQVQISTSDPDARQMITRNNITEVAYNVQSTVDAKHCLPIDYEVTNRNDSKALGPAAERAALELGHSRFTLLADKGYHTGSELKAAQELGVETIVAIPDVSGASMAPDPAYNVSEFTYSKRTHTYTCPQGQKLTTNGRWYRKERSAVYGRRGDSVMVQHFKTKACQGCPALVLCTKNTGGRGRVIERTEHQNYIDKNRKNVQAKELLYKRRQAIVEHPFGIIKRQWGFYFVLSRRGIDRAAADVGLIFIAYNFRRIMSIISPEVLKTYFKSLQKAIFSLFQGFWQWSTPERMLGRLRIIFEGVPPAPNFQLSLRVQDGGFETD